MTRINCVPPAELHTKHLLAEYRELPRVFRLAFAAYQRGERPEDQPTEYVLGPGHVRFFYPRLTYLRDRFVDVADELHFRGVNCAYRSVPTICGHVPDAWWQDWTPTPAALALNRARIAERMPRA